MHQMTENSTVSQTILCIGCLISCVGLLIDPSKIVLVTGLTMVSSGMIQSYYGAVFEIERRRRIWYFVLGFPLGSCVAYSAFLSLRDYLPTWYSILAVVFVTLCFQFLISIITLTLLRFRRRANDMQ